MALQNFQVNTYATCAYIGTTMCMPFNEPWSAYYNMRGDLSPSETVQIRKTNGKESRKKYKSESNAQQLLRDMIGHSQWSEYRQTNIVSVPTKSATWMIGNIFGNYDKFNPFSGKPDVVRIDNMKNLSGTSFCVQQAGGEKTPYTDQVISFMVHLVDDEQAFLKMANRIKEVKFNKMKRCAVWELS